MVVSYSLAKLHLHEFSLNAFDHLVVSLKVFLTYSAEKKMVSFQTQYVALHYKLAVIFI